MSVKGVYLAYPIDQMVSAHEVYLYDQIEKFKQMLIDFGAAQWVFDPGDAFRVHPHAELDDGLPRINRHALNNADVTAAFLPAGKASVGVPMEIDRAHSLGRLTIVFSDAKSWMLQYPGRRAPIRFHDWEDESLARAIDAIGAYIPEDNDYVVPDELRVMKLDPTDTRNLMPTRTFSDDAGLDLIVSETTTVYPGRFEDIPCGIAVELPGHTWGLVTGRSSALRKRGLLIHSGVIDAGYRGPLFAGAWNMRDKKVTIEAGERIAQLIVMNNATRRTVPFMVDQLSPSARGVAGFGSTGA